MESVATTNSRSGAPVGPVPRIGPQAALQAQIDKPVRVISGAAGTGMRELLFEVWRAIETHRAERAGAQDSLQADTGEDAGWTP